MVAVFCFVFAIAPMASFRPFCFAMAPMALFLHSHMVPLVIFVCHGSHSIFHAWTAKMGEVAGPSGNTFTS
jgi:hypothetical protein